MLNPIKVTVSGDTFEIAPLPAMRATALHPLVAGPTAEAVRALKFAATAMRGDVTLEKLLALEDGAAIDLVVDTFQRVCAQLPPANVQAIFRELLYRTTINPANAKPVWLFAATGEAPGDPFDVVMQGRTLDGWVLVVHALKLNYPDFFKAVLDLGARFGAANPSAGSNTSANAGTAGA